MPDCKSFAGNFGNFLAIRHKEKGLCQVLTQPSWVLPLSCLSGKLDRGGIAVIVDSSYVKTACQ